METELTLYFREYKMCFGGNKLRKNQLDVSIALSKAKVLYEKTVIRTE